MSGKGYDKLRSRAKYIFPMFIYLKERYERGEIDGAVVQDLVNRNMAEHGRYDFKVADDWGERIDEVIKLSGYYLFDHKGVVERGRAGSGDGGRGSGNEAKRKVVIIRRKRRE